jgi:hypothetical protein
MKHRLFIAPILLTVIFANACRKESVIDTKLIPIRESLNMETFAFEGGGNDEKTYLLSNTVIINSAEQLKKPFETWNLETPEVLTQFDWQKYTFLLRFGVEIRTVADIKHELFHHIHTGQYTYYLRTTVFAGYDENGSFVMPTHPEPYFFYTGILIDKIPDESEILSVNTSYWTE